MKIVNRGLAAGIAAALAVGIFALVLFAVLLFLPAGTLNYWQAWVFIAIFIVTTTGPNIYLAMRRPEVLRRRLSAGPRAETRPAQKVISVGYIATFLALLLISALDYRFGWSQVPTTVAVLGDALLAVGLGIAMLAVLQNSYAAARVTVESDQKVVSTGIYGMVRHPMYFGALIAMVGTPLALGSYWGLVVLIPGIVVLVFRILDEEKVLRQELDGYRDYTDKVHARLVPYVW
jgi:protein-S-isoprenylcysteine O-methyltransferase Ste14